MLESTEFYRDISQLCLKRLNDSFDSSRGLFSRQLRNMKWESTLGTEDMTSTAICIIGLLRANLCDEVEFDLHQTLDALVNVSNKHNYRGGMGLVIWANAVADGLKLNQLMKRIEISEVETGELVAPLTTMESSWLLSGLIHEYKRCPDETTKQSMITVMDEIMNRFETKTSLFHHATSAAPIKVRLRKHIANFADQIYSVQALSYAAIILQEEKPLNFARNCAIRLVELQGSRGQWWWHYNAVSGKVAQYFPVYSVHQHAMAPMALMTLAAAGGGNFERSISLSQQWIDHNELGVNLRDSQAGTIWRDIAPNESSFSRFTRHGRSLLGLQCTAGEYVNSDCLSVNYETRPYEWAWCLFAGSIAGEPSPPSQFVA